MLVARDRSITKQKGAADDECVHTLVGRLLEREGRELAHSAGLHAAVSGNFACFKKRAHLHEIRSVSETNAFTRTVS